MSLNKKCLEQFKAYKFMKRKLKFNLITKIEAKTQVFFLFIFFENWLEVRFFVIPNAFFSARVTLREKCSSTKSVQNNPQHKIM